MDHYAEGHWVFANGWDWGLVIYLGMGVGGVGKDSYAFKLSPYTSFASVIVFLVRSLTSSFTTAGGITVLGAGLLVLRTMGVE